MTQVFGVTSSIDYFAVINHTSTRTWRIYYEEVYYAHQVIGKVAYKQHSQPRTCERHEKRKHSEKKIHIDI